MEKTTLTDIDFSAFSTISFKVNHIFIEEEGHLENIYYEEELDGIDMDGIGNLEDLRRLMFIDETFGNLRVVVDCKELTRNMNKKKKPEGLQFYRCTSCEKCYR